MKFLLFLLYASFSHAVPTYVPPKEDTPLIRRDQLPLDVAGVQLVSKQLAILASDDSVKSAQDLHASAQLIALALHLNPANTEASQINNDLSNKKLPAPANEKSRAAAAAYLWRTSEWLLSAKDKPEAQKLGQLILAPLSHLDNGHPLPANADPAAQNWLGTIASLKEFGFEEKMPDAPAPEPDLPDDGRFFKVKVIAYKMPAFGVYDQLVIIRDKINKSSSERSAKFPEPSAILPITLTIGEKVNPSFYQAEPGAEGEIFFNPSSQKRATDSNLFFHPAVGLQTAAAIESELNAFFKNRNVTLPADKIFYVNTTNYYKKDKYNADIPDDERLNISFPTENLYNMVAPIAIMLDSSMSGQKLKKDTVLLANLKADGSLGVPNEVWNLIQEITDHGPNLRIIIPASLESRIGAFLPLKTPGKLFNTEFILANTYAEARPFLFEGETEPEGFAAAHAHWQEVKDKQPKGTEVIDYINLAGVHAKLKSAVDASSRHLSAKQLYLFGTKNKPNRLPTELAARELGNIIKEIPAILGLLENPARSANQNSDYNRVPNPPARADLAEAKTNKLLAQLEKLQPIIDFNDRELMIESTDILNRILTISRAFRANKKYIHLALELVDRAYEFQSKLAALASYPKPEKQRLPDSFYPQR